MAADDLHDRDFHLRSELDAASAAEPWDSQRIDRIAELLIPLEAALDFARPEYGDL